MIRTAVQREAIDLADSIAGLEQGGAGGIATFSGYVRVDDGVSTLELEHYPGMTDTVIDRLARQAAVRWSLSGVVLIHRIGVMTPGERIVFVGTAAAHRAAALDACAYLIDRLKTDMPFWKRERRGEDSRWVAARDKDAAAAARWMPEKE